MPKYIIALTIVMLTLSACSDERRPVQRPANLDDGSIDVFDSRLPDYVAGTQEDLVAHVGDRVFFSYDSAELSSNAQRTLERQTQWLEMNPNIRITIEGHADERGTREYNLALGERRAVAVRNYLTSLGADRDRINIISYGKERPVDLESNEISWSKNRRGVTVVRE